MRFVFALSLTVTAAALARTQPPPKEVTATLEPRFGIPVKIKTYPQDTAKKALASAVEAVEKADTSYLIAHLLDPGFVELRLSDRARQYEAAVELELARLRDFQIMNPDKFQPEDRVPLDRAKFNALIIERSRERAFRQLIRDVDEKLLNDPHALKDMKKILRDGTVADEPGGAKATHPDVKDRALYFKKIGERWFLENRQEEAPKTGPDEKKPEEKKQ
jgi:hypothetical protein